MEHQRVAKTNQQKHTQPSPSPALQPRAPVHPILQLQQTIGNRAVRRLIQTKLAAGRPKGSMPDGHHPAGGELLDAETHAFLESRFGQRFDDVRVNPRAGQLPKTAVAAAQGNQLRFVPWLAQTPTPIRRAVIAHEAVHVLQWRRGRQTSDRPWSEQRLEAEAHEVGLVAARGGTPTVRGVARDDRPRFHPIFISTFGTPAFLEAARDFYVRWGYGTPQSVSSIEEIVMQLGKEAGHLDRVTIVSHAVPDNINMSFLRGGPGFVALTDWDLTTREALPRYSAHPAREGLAEQVMRDVRRDRANRDLLARLRPDIAEPRMHQFVWWLVDVDLLARAQPRNAIPNRGQVVRRARENAQAYKEILKAELREFARFDPEARATDMDALEQAINAVLRGYNYDPVPAGVGRLMARQVLSGRDAAVRRVLEQQPTVRDSTFWLSLLYARLRLGSGSVIEIKGCRIGQHRDYLEAISRFFAWPDTTGPTVTAPDMFQLYGTMAGQAHPDNTGHLRGLWRNRALRQAFLYWAGVFGWNLSDPPVADDLVAVLRAGHAFPVGTTLHFLAGSDPGSVTAWFARFGYHLTNAPDIESAFFTGRSLGGAMRFTIVEWLQDRRPGQRPRQFIFPPDPEYQNHIQSVQASPLPFP